MTGIVALEEGLEDIEKFLRKKGLQTVSLESGNLAVDAVVYKDRRLSEMPLEHLTSSLDSAYDYNGEGAFGVLLVNAQNKTPQQVYEIIKNRVYEHLL